MKIVLSEIELDPTPFQGEGVKVVRLKPNAIGTCEGQAEVVAIIGCRATARKVLGMNFPGLRLYQLTSAGFDGIQVEKFKEKGIYLCNAGDVYSTPIAETVVYGMLQYAKRYWNNPKWHFLRPTRGYRFIGELSGKRLLVMGCGRIGTAVATRAAAFEMDVCGYDPYITQKGGYREIYNTREALIARLADFNYIVTTIPLSDATEGFLNAELFSAMSPKAVIINVGRKGIFNEVDFYRALKTRQIQGAVLDMFEKVPNPITNPFRRLSNTIVLPGVSAISAEVRVRLRKHVCANVQKVLNGEKPGVVIN